MIHPDIHREIARQRHEAVREQEIVIRPIELRSRGLRGDIDIGALQGVRYLSAHRRRPSLQIRSAAERRDDPARTHRFGVDSLA